VGGAERNARKRRQEKSASGKAAVAQARGGGDTKKVIAVVVGVVLLAGAVIGGVLWTNASKNATEGQAIPTVEAVPGVQYPVEREGVVVVSGQQDAPTTIDVYADFLCPICAQFEEKYGEQIEQKVGAGELKVRTHMLPMLVERSDPPGYSLDAANAALCAADEGKFTAYHDSLFESQPEEGKRGYDKQQLIQLGRDLGITSDTFADCVNNGTYNQELTSKLEKVTQDPALEQDFGGGQMGFGTPTVVSGGEIVDFSDPQWLDKLIASSQS
jgi:protein-disulfide isomerase